MEKLSQAPNIAFERKAVKDQDEDFSAAWNYVDRNTDKFVNELIRLVRQPSVSSQNLGLKECAELVRSMMESLGIKTEMVSITGAPLLVYGELRSNDKNAKTLVIYNHYDVRPAEPISEWRTEPFNPHVERGMIYGRGVSDDKGELVARFSAINALLETGSSVRPNIKWVVEGEEETGSLHLLEYVTKHRTQLKGDGCLWEGCDRSTNGTSEIRLGTKGLLYIELRVKTGLKEPNSMYAPIASNAAWRLIDLLRTIRDEKGRILIEGFYDDALKPTALEKKFLKNNEFSLNELKKSLGGDYLLEGKDDLEIITNLLYEPTANIAGFGSGFTGEGARTIIPSEAFVKMDFRLVANMRAKEILEKIRKHLRTSGFGDVELVVHWKDDPAKTSIESHIAQTMIRCSELVIGKEPNVWPTCPGTGILSLFTDKLNLETAMGLGVSYSDSDLHAPNENIRIEDYKQAIKELVCLLRLF